MPWSACRSRLSLCDPGRPAFSAPPAHLEAHQCHETTHRAGGAGSGRWEDRVELTEPQRVGSSFLRSLTRAAGLDKTLTSVSAVAALGAWMKFFSGDQLKVSQRLCRLLPDSARGVSCCFTGGNSLRPETGALGGGEPTIQCTDDIL